MTPEDLDVMARTVWGEARGEGLGGKIAVAWVIKNRADNPGWWGDGLAGVCKRPWQFSCWNANDPNRGKLLTVTYKDDMFRDCLLAVGGVLSGNLPDPTRGANHYCTKNLSPNWSVGKEPTSLIGNHKFYKL